MGKFFDDSESILTVSPTLASWIGLNEGIFLRQLHFILTRKNDVGKFADGRKWYRDKPHDFVVKYFPFWDEGIVKRVIDNLRADGMLMARSDLNQDHKDRSLWYTIHYEAIERLTGPVERIVNKSAKRKEARAARKSRDEESDNYTKVQNVLLNEIPTNCTFDPGTKCTSEKVQNVLTPKESSSKTPLPKDTTPIGVAAKPQPARSKPEPIPAVRVHVEVTGKYSLNKAQIKEIAEVVGDTPMALEKWRSVVKAWVMRDYKPNRIDGMLEWFKDGIPIYQKHENSFRNGSHPPANKSSPLLNKTRLEELQAESAKEIYDPLKGT